MKRKRGWLFYPLIIVALLLCAIPAHAAIPTLPHAFYGTLTVGGSAASVGTVVTAKVAEVQCGSITTTVEGQYGGSGAFDAKLTVSGEIATGATISFYVDDVDTTQTYAFSSGGVTELNLTAEPPIPGDTTPPTVIITALTPDPTNDNTPTFTGTATDTESNISSVEYKVDAGSWTAASASDGTFNSLSEGYTFTTAALADGAHTVYVRATDAATIPNTTVEANYATDSFTVDTVAPSVTITALTPDPTTDNTPTFTGTATDTLSNISSVEYKVDDGSWTAASATDGSFDSLPYLVSEDYNFTTSALSEGAHTVYVRATDSAVNTTVEANYASDSFTVATGVTPGDATGDGLVDARDITKVERIIAGLDAATPGADATQDGLIDARDITMVERIIAGLE